MVVEVMSTCKDCVHYELCKYNAYQEAHYFGKDKKIYISIDNNSACKFFKSAADFVEVDKVAKLLLLSFGGDTCACNFNGNDEWLWEKCKYSETECPYPPDELGCWKEYIKHMLAKMDEN
jgi:hypothetical protein